MDESVRSKDTGSEDEPLVPDDFDEQYYQDLLSKVQRKCLASKDAAQIREQTAQDELNKLKEIVEEHKKEEQYNQLKVELENLQRSHDILQNTLSQHQTDVKIMRTEIKNLVTERNVLRKDRENAVDLRQELLRMHRIVNQERIKTRALQDELLTPMNIHRWRHAKSEKSQVESPKAEVNTKSLEEKSNAAKIEDLKADLFKVKNQLLQERKIKQNCWKRQALMKMQMQCLSAPPQLQVTFNNTGENITSYSKFI
ncbi:Cilia- and flagella-associated protein 58 [Eumeta japonica]|uniref:Cilia-and flagella-associated protein 58 n=1 Tax=Eumeta variegata TaxID=151549 RepID=A0A4C1SB09_EUMVA|nr:Cilia- and flagella-associated protein 58 [Eumeta japonica]